jgi:hypothetical protein
VVIGDQRGHPPAAECLTVEHQRARLGDRPGAAGDRAVQLVQLGGAQAVVLDQINVGRAPFRRCGRS